MQDLFNQAAVDGLRYLDVLRHQPVRPSVEAFEGYLDQPRPERKSLIEAVKASRAPTGVDVLAWMLAIDWVEVIETESGNKVDITDLGQAILSISDARSPEVVGEEVLEPAGDDAPAWGDEDLYANEPEEASEDADAHEHAASG